MARRRRGGALRPSTYIRRAAVKKGVLGDDRFWRTVFLLITGRRVLRRILGSEPEVVAVEKLQPGQFVRIEAIDPATIPPTTKRRRTPRRLAK